jgi:hypothetical protein
VLKANVYGDASDQVVRALAQDSQGNVIIAGEFNGTVAFDPAAPLQATGTTTDLYLAKFDATGNPLWSKRFHPIANPGTSHIVSAGTDSQGNILIAGTLGGSTDFGAGAVGINDGGFITKFSPDGTPMWTVPFYADPYVDFTTVYDAAFDSAGNTVLFGTVYCGQTCLPDTTLQLWIAKFDSGGQKVWAKLFTPAGPSDDRVAGGVAISPFGDVLITGSFTGTERFDPNTTQLQSAGGHDAFIAKFDSTGKHLWSASYGDSGEQAGVDVGTDSLGSVYVVGTFSGTVTFGGTGTQLISAGKSDIFVVKLSSAKAYAWSKSFGNGSDQFATSMSVDKSGTLVFTGGSVGPVDFGGGTQAGGGGFDLPLVKLDGNGGYLWSRVFGDSADQIGRAVVLTSNGEELLAADVRGVTDVGSMPLSSAGGVDILLGRFAP